MSLAKGAVWLISDGAITLRTSILPAPRRPVRSGYFDDSADAAPCHRSNRLVLLVCLQQRDNLRLGFRSLGSALPLLLVQNVAANLPDHGAARVGFHRYSFVRPSWVTLYCFDDGGGLFRISG
jgi:hypothetical protein